MKMKIKMRFDLTLVRMVIIKKSVLCCAVLCLVTQLCSTLCDLMDHSPSGSSVHGDSPGKNTGVGYHNLLQRVFPTQGLNPGLQHCRQILYCLHHGKDHEDWSG